jgi:hypothetical protein
MMHKTKALLVAIVLNGAVASIAAAQTQAPAQTDSLGDYARSVRKDKDKDTPTSAKKFDNDNLPMDDKLSVVGQAPADDANKVAEAAQPGEGNPEVAKPDAEANKTSDTKETKPPVTAADQQKLDDTWKGKMADQKNQVDLATRELDVAQKEYQLKAAQMYGDVGNRLRNSAEWDKENTQYKSDIDQKQKALEDAKQKLDDMQEEARKAGASSSARE